MSQMLFVISFETIGFDIRFISLKSQIRSGISSTLQLRDFRANHAIGHCVFDDNVASLECKTNFILCILKRIRMHFSFNRRRRFSQFHLF